jgi:hypothetical protein
MQINQNIQSNQNMQVDKTFNTVEFLDYVIILSNNIKNKLKLYGLNHTEFSFNLCKFLNFYIEKIINILKKEIEIINNEEIKNIMIKMILNNLEKYNMENIEKLEDIFFYILFSLFTVISNIFFEEDCFDIYIYPIIKMFINTFNKYPLSKDYKELDEKELKKDINNIMGNILENNWQKIHIPLY